ncbi:MAG: Asp-tRNA(Asn)/Glu-tRNA(Gln) amidotransferase subunit GatB [Acidimicrobiales bacterium]|nr:Asp-tRNA(Asn)/Glu-tRNA(Gln) amidotransferase subunit GatB [Acidimicrobiales bacterium]
MAQGSSGGQWETVVGLEVHCELRTETKLFCSCRNAFGEEPNTLVCPVCLGLPGSLPVLNRAAVELAMRIGVALHSDIRPSVFHRKNYFYPDMPKDYQITQYDEPICVGGWLELPDGSRVGIVRAHLEEDTGKSTHVGETGRIHEATASLVDYNRAGVPLVEIVSAPDLRSGEQARQYVDELRGILVATGASDGRMEEGSLRVDANVSVRPAGSSALGTRCEVKNLNSLRSLRRAVEWEAERQARLLSEGGVVDQETRHWDEEARRTVVARSKEEAEDYRYFPEPDLAPVVPGDEWVARVRAELPPLPAERRARVAALLGGDGLSAGDAAQVTTVVELGLDDLVVGAVGEGADPRRALRRAANEAAAYPEAARSLEPEAFRSLLDMEAGGKLTATQAKEVLAELLQRGGGDPDAIAKSKGFEAMGSGALTDVVNQVVTDNADAWEKYRAGDNNVEKFLVGQVMKLTRGRADPKAVTKLLEERR